MVLPSTRNKREFTFVDLLVLILILAILITIAMMVLLDFKEKGHLATFASDLSSAHKMSAEDTNRV